MNEENGICCRMRVTNSMLDRKDKGPSCSGRNGILLAQQARNRARCGFALLALLLMGWSTESRAFAQQADPSTPTHPMTSEASHAPDKPRNVPPRVIEAERFLAQRGWTAGHGLPTRRTARSGP